MAFCRRSSVLEYGPTHKLHAKVQSWVAQRVVRDPRGLEHVYDGTKNGYVAKRRSCSTEFIEEI